MLTTTSEDISIMMNIRNTFLEMGAVPATRRRTLSEDSGLNVPRTSFTVSSRDADPGINCQGILTFNENLQEIVEWKSADASLCPTPWSSLCGDWGYQNELDCVVGEYEIVQSDPDTISHSVQVSTRKTKIAVLWDIENYENQQDVDVDATVGHFYPKAEWIQKKIYYKTKMSNEIEKHLVTDLGYDKQLCDESETTVEILIAADIFKTIGDNKNDHIVIVLIASGKKYDYIINVMQAYVHKIIRIAAPEQAAIAKYGKAVEKTVKKQLRWHENVLHTDSTRKLPNAFKRTSDPKFTHGKSRPVIDSFVDNGEQKSFLYASAKVQYQVWEI